MNFQRLSLTKQGTSDTVLSTSVRLGGHHPFPISGSAKTVLVSTRVGSALRTLSTLFGSGKSANSRRSSRSVKPILEEKAAPCAATHSNSQSASQSQDRSRSGSSSKSRSESEDRSDMAVHRLHDRLDAYNTSFRHSAELNRSASNKNINTGSTNITSAKHTLQVQVQDKNTTTSSKNHTSSNPNSFTNTTTNNTATYTTASSKQPYQDTLHGQRGQDLAQKMLSRLEDLPDLPDQLLGTVIYLPANAGKGTSTKGGSEGVSVYNTNTAMGNSSKKTVSQDRLAAYFQPLPLFASIEDLCDPSVIERIPFRQHPCLQPPRCVSRLSVEVWGASAEVESTKTEAYNHPTTSSVGNGAYPTYFNTAFLTTSPNYEGSPCMSVPEEEYGVDVHKVKNAGSVTFNYAANTNTNASTTANMAAELEAPVAFSAQRKPDTNNANNTTHAASNTSTPNTKITTTTNSTTNSTSTTAAHSANPVGTEKQTSRVVRPIVSMLRSALQGHSRVGVAGPGDE